MQYVELAVRVRPEAADAAADIVRRHVPAGVSIEPPFEAIDEEGRVEFHDAPAVVRAWLSPEQRNAVTAVRRELRALGDAVVSVRSRAVDDTVWKDRWKDYFPVLRVGRRIVVKPSWRGHRRRKDDLAIEIDPGSAFGTGQHATTRLCLEALEDRVTPGARVLDVGCGSGILSVAAALLGATRVDAVDIDPQAVRATAENAARNGVAGVVRAREGSLGEAWPFRGTARKRYDIVVANISARVVRELAVELVGALRARSRTLLIVSGVIDEQEARTVEALEAAGGGLVSSRGEEGWRLLEVARAG